MRYFVPTRVLEKQISRTQWHVLGEETEVDCGWCLSWEKKELLEISLCCCLYSQTQYQSALPSSWNFSLSVLTETPRASPKYSV